jgi:hypothetical protein
MAGLSRGKWHDSIARPGDRLPWGGDILLPGRADRAMAYEPQTLARTGALVARALREGEDPFIPIRDFVDDYRRLPPADRPRLVAEAPPWTGDARYDAYLAAMAEHFASEDGHAPPAWVERPERFLDRAWFREPRVGFWPMALAQAPPAFRRRYVYIEASEFHRV